MSRSAEDERLLDLAVQVQTEAYPDLLPIIAHVLVMGQNSYDSPEAFARGLLRRLAHDGYVVTRGEWS